MNVVLPEHTELDVSRETLERLAVFAELLIKWNPRINLIAKSTLPELWTRHIQDSIQVYRAATGTPKKWVDLGSGGGFPGVIIAIIAVEEAPDLDITLIESDQRKSAFLRTAIRETGANAKVLTDRIESAPPQNADILSARALADLDTLLGFAARHLSSTGTALFSKGITWGKEVEAAQSRWRFEHEAIKSQTDSQAVILKIKGVSRV